MLGEAAMSASCVHYYTGITRGAPEKFSGRGIIVQWKWGSDYNEMPSNPSCDWIRSQIHSDDSQSAYRIVHSVKA